MDKKPEKKVNAVVSGKAGKQKRSGVTKFADVFVEEDVKAVKSYAVSEVVIPAIKNLIYDVVVGSLGMSLFGDTRGVGAGRRGGSGVRTPYESMFNSRGAQKASPKRSNARRRTGYAFENVLLESKGEAELVLDNLYELVDTYGMASVMDLYDLSGLETRHTDKNWGWYDVSGANIRNMGADGYLIEMPRPQELN